MIKWFAYIVLLLMFAPRLLFADTIKNNDHFIVFSSNELFNITSMPVDTTISKKTKQQQEDEKKKVKEIAKAKRQTKPEKVDENAKTDVKAKPKREQRPEGLVRPPEIPRRSGN
jgi:hypothetical protein